MKKTKKSDKPVQHDLYADHGTQAAPSPMEMLAARQAALDLLTDILSRKQPLDQALEAGQSFKALPQRDRSFCRMMVSTVLRRLGQIDDLITRFQEKPGSGNLLLQNILRLGVAQIIFMNVPDHAAVDTSVRLADAHGLERQKGFVNGLLRNLAREGKYFASKQDESRLNTPEWLLKLWIDDYGMRPAAEIALANLAEAPLDFSLKNETERSHWIETLGAVAVGHATLRRNSGGAVHELPGFEDGMWWVQDASAALPAGLFGDLKDKHVVDLCAAPGGKTLQLAARGAQVTALDRSAQRVKKLEENAKRMRLEENIKVVVSDATHWRPVEAPHYILLDAPCSATGTIRRHPDVPHLKSLRDVESLISVQERILENAFDILAPGGTLVYCTCSLQKAEGEHQIAAFLERHPNAAKIVIRPEEIGGLGECITEDGDVRILPFHRAAQGGMDGFFISRLTKIQ